MKFKNEVDLNEFEINLIALSPIVNQSLSQLNIDLIIFAIFYLTIKRFPKKTFLNLTMFLCLSLLKYHPIGLIFGYILLSGKENESTVWYILSHCFHFCCIQFFSQLDTNFFY